MTLVHRSLLLATLSLFTTAVQADVTLRPNEKPKETSKDFAKDQKKNGFASPEPENRTAQFVAGQSVQVELQVSTSFLGFVKFVIRDQPKYGTLSDIRPTPGGDTNRALVTYTHNGDAEHLDDRFTFAARIGDGVTSASGVVTLVGHKAMARLEVLSAPKFKRLQPGEQDSATFVVVNSGNAPFSGDLVLPAPFVGPHHFDVAVNEKLTMMLMAKPPVPGTYRLDQELQPGVPSSRLLGIVECAQPFVVTPGAVVLAYDPASGRRKATVKVSNGSEAPLTLVIDGGPRLLVAKGLSLEPRAVSEVEISLPKEDVAYCRGEVWIIQEPSRQKVVVTAEPTPAKIRLLNPDGGKIDFGTVNKGKKAEARISIINEGGVAAVLQASQAPPFLVSTDLAKLKGEPGKVEEITITFAAELPGSYNQALYIAGNAGRLEINARGVMVDPSRPGTGAGAASGAAGATGPVRPKQVESAPARPSPVRPSVSAPPAPMPVSAPPAPAVVSSPDSAPKPTAVRSTQASIAESPPEAAKQAMPLSKMNPATAAAYGQLMTFGVSPTTLPPFQSHSLEPVPSIGVMDLGKDNVVLLWEAPKVEPSKYLIETSYLTKNDATGLWLKVWKPYDAWEKVKSPKNGLTAAKVTGLSPETQYELRVLGIDSEGKFSRPSDIVQVATLSPFRLPGWIWPALGSVILLAVAYTGYQLKQGDWQT